MCTASGRELSAAFSWPRPAAALCDSLVGLAPPALSVETLGDCSSDAPGSGSQLATDRLCRHARLVPPSASKNPWFPGTTSTASQPRLSPMLPQLKCSTALAASVYLRVGLITNLQMRRSSQTPRLYTALCCVNNTQGAWRTVSALATWTEWLRDAQSETTSSRSFSRKQGFAKEPQKRILTTRPPAHIGSTKRVRQTLPAP